MEHYLFVPAQQPERINKALATGVAHVIVDLEDAVAPQDKNSARERLSAWLQSNPEQSVLVRINAYNTPWHSDDLQACSAPNVRAVVVPKAESVEVLKAIALALPDKLLLPIIESAQGLHHVHALAHGLNVSRLLFGKLDLAIDLGLDYPPPTGEDPDETVFLYARSQLVLASRCAGIAAPIDGVYTHLTDAPGLIHYARQSARLGFAGLLLIHPKQLEPALAAFAPNAHQIAWAQAVLDGYATHQGAAFMLNGAMVDAPVVTRAQKIQAAIMKNEK